MNKDLPIKNKIVIRTEHDNITRKYEIYNFTRVSYEYKEDGQSYLKIECDAKVYQFKSRFTIICEIDSY